jgi:hypothetical protein
VCLYIYIYINVYVDFVFSWRVRRMTAGFMSLFGGAHEVGPSGAEDAPSDAQRVDR